MENDDITAKIDAEMKELQEGLKDRLKETQELGDLGKQVSKSTFSLEEHTSTLKKSSYKLKMKKMLEYYQYIIGGILALLLLLFVIYRKSAG